MSTNYHTPLSKGDPVEVAYVNTPMAALDAQITAHAVSILALESEIADARNGKETLADFLKTPIPYESIDETGGEGVAGQYAWDENYLYLCVATNTWKRVALSSWS